MSKQPHINFTNISDGKGTFEKEFQTMFPTLNKLLLKASWIDFTINGNQLYRQYIWTDKQGNTSGWLCHMEHCVPRGRNIIQEHAVLSKNVGTIVQYWMGGHRAIDTFLKANEHTFTLKDAVIGMGGWEENYLAACKSEGIEPLDVNEFVTFALEANGNTTFYNSNTKEVFFFAHDGYSPIDLSIVKGQPEYTIHKFDLVNTFTDYAEQLAHQWEKVIG